MKTATLWATPDRARYFLVPDDADLPPGDFAVRRSTGEERRVDEAAARSFEVSEDEAKAWLKGQLGEVLGEAKGKLTGWVEGLRQKTAEMRAENEAAWAEGDADTPPGPGRQAAERLGGFLHHFAESVRKGAEEEARRAREAKPDPGPDD